MARIRSTKPEFWSDRKLALRVGRDARLLYIALWNFSDEHGRLQGDARYVKGNCLPYDDDIGLDEIDTLLAELEGAGRIRRYEHDGDPYIYLPKLAEHQRLEPAKVPSRLPAPPDPDVSRDKSAPASEPRADESAPDPDESALLYVAGGREQVAGGRSAARAQVATIDEPPTEDPTDALMAEHVAAYTEPPPPDAYVAVKREVMRLVGQGRSPALISAGLARMRTRRVGPALLGQLVTECIPTTDTPKSTTDQRVAAGIDLAKLYRERGE